MRRALLIVAVVALASCKAVTLNTDPTWPHQQANVSPPAVYQVAWWTPPLVKTGLLEYQPSETATPGVDPDTERVIVSSRDGMIRCLSPVNGKEEWSFKTYGRPFAGATVLDGVAYVPGGDGVLYALRSVSGEKIWEYRTGEEIVTVPTVVDNKILIASQSETLFAVDRETGKWIWQYRRDPPSGFSIRGTSTPIAAHGQVFMGFADGTLAALGLEDGIAHWEKKLTTSGGTQFLDVDTTPVVDDHGHVYAASYKDGLYALDEKTGDVEWTLSRPGITSLFLKGNTLFTAGDGSLAAIETAKGRQLWVVDLSDRTSKGKTNNAGRALTFARGYLVVPTSTALAFVEPSTGKVRAMWNPGRGITATPMRFNSPRFGPRLFVISNLGNVYALNMVSRG